MGLWGWHSFTGCSASQLVMPVLRSLSPPAPPPALPWRICPKHPFRRRSYRWATLSRAWAGVCARRKRGGGEPQGFWHGREYQRVVRGMGALPGWGGGRSKVSASLGVPSPLFSPPHPSPPLLLAPPTLAPPLPAASHRRPARQEEVDSYIHRLQERGWDTTNTVTKLLRNNARFSLEVGG